jgi:uncharacterized protein (DUF4213/DUF364 family)
MPMSHADVALTPGRDLPTDGSGATLIDCLCDRLLPVAAGRRVLDVRVGLGYTGVLLDNGRCGLAYTFRDMAEGRGCNVLDLAGTMAERPAADIAQLARSQDAILTAVGLATLNALSEPPAANAGDVLEQLALEPEDEVVMVGLFRPLMEPLRKQVKALRILERNPDPAAGILSADAANEVLPRCQVAIVTATSLLNRTMDGLLALCRNAREIVVLGPSTPLEPAIFAGKGVTILSGVWVTDAARALRIISEGGGTKKMQPAVRKVNLRIRPPRH